MENLHIDHFLVAMETIPLHKVDYNFWEIPSVTQNWKQTVKTPSRTKFRLKNPILVDYVSIKQISHSEHYSLWDAMLLELI